MGYVGLANRGSGRAFGHIDAVDRRQESLHAWLLRAARSARTRAAAKSGIDLILMVGAAGWAWLICAAQAPGACQAWWFVLAVVGIRLLVYHSLRLYRMPWRRVSSHDALWLAWSAALAVPLLGALLFAFPAALGIGGLPRLYLLLMTEPALYLTLLGGARIGARTVVTSYRGKNGGRRVLIAGTGDAALSLVWQIQNSDTEYKVVALVDDNPERYRERVLGVPVMGAIRDLVNLAPRLAADQIVIAIPSLSPERLREVLEICEPIGLPIRIVPPLRELMDGRVSLSRLREVRMEDLLPRAAISLDKQAISRYLQGRTVLVTGGGGSVGGELCRQVLKVGARRLLVLGRGENSVFEIVQELNAALGEEWGVDCEVVPVVCDVQDRRSLTRVFAHYHPDVVFHAAAHKHVPLMEQYPAEAIRNNVLGTLNAVSLSVEYLVSRFVLVSTDKAVNPASVMGSTKRVAEKIVKGFAVAKNVNMVSVRFGNVLGSRGSVIPLMKRQIQNGQPVTVTDPNMVRYFMTIPEAAQLILQAGAIGGRGEVFVLDMGHPVRVLALAKDLIRLSGLVPDQDVPIRIIGRRPGEKLQEDLLNETETMGARRDGPFYIAPAEPVHLSRLLFQIKQLRRAAEAHCTDRVVRMLREIVPTYSPDAAHAQSRTSDRPVETELVRQAS